MAEPNDQNQAADVASNTDEADKSKKPPAAKAAKADVASDTDEADKSTKPAAAKAPKKEKPPALEDKPFADFIQQDYVPSVQKAMDEQGVKDLQLTFAKQKIPITGFEGQECWQLIGSWLNGKRQFNLYFTEENIQAKKAFSCNEGKKPSTLESFLIDERKTTLDLLMWGLMQRLNAQKWLARN